MCEKISPFCSVFGIEAVKNGDKHTLVRQYAIALTNLAKIKVPKLKQPMTNSILRILNRFPQKNAFLFSYFVYNYHGRHL